MSLGASELAENLGFVMEQIMNDIAPPVKIRPTS